jgi:predicted nucleic acid-binding protein
VKFEIGYALTRRVRRRELSAANAALLWRELEDGPLHLAADSSVLERAFELSLALRASFYDCVYLGLAIAEGDILLTADAGFIRAVRATADRALAGRVLLLAEI